MNDTLISNYERQVNLLQKDIKQSIVNAHTIRYIQYKLI